MENTSFFALFRKSFGCAIKFAMKQNAENFSHIQLGIKSAAEYVQKPLLDGTMENV